MRRLVHGVSLPTLSAAVLALASLAMPIAKSAAEDAAALRTPSVAAYDEIISKFDREHWAFRPVRAPQVPKVDDGHWIRNPIDNFILAPLEAKGWKPNDAAKPHAWLRRVFLAVVGLPPTPAEQDAFLRTQGEAAFDKLADELLSGPGYGERGGRNGLDLVRDADAKG